MSIIGIIVFYFAVPAILLLFVVYPPRHAVVVATIGCWLFLPIAEFAMPSGLPDYTKISAMSLGILLGALLFDSTRLTNLRFRWFDIPAVVWCFGPMVSALSNDLGVYDGISSISRETTMWGIPYLIGRAYFGDEEGLKVLATGIVAGAIVYTPFCLYEIRMSPRLHVIVYGFAARDLIGSGFQMRYGGYRPMVFMETGLALAMYMAVAGLLAYCLWVGGVVRNFMKIPTKFVYFGLMVMNVLCKGTGAVALLVIGIGMLWIAKVSGRQSVFVALIIMAPLYVGLRTTRAWDAESFIAFINESLDEDRGQSLQFRIDNENMLIDRAMQRPIFGWGGFGRNFVRDENGRVLTIIDGYWIIALGLRGFMGLTCLVAIQILPMILYLRNRSSRPWNHASNAAAAGLAVVLCLYSIDNLLNAMFNPIFVVIAGGLMGLPRLSKVNPSANPDVLARVLKNQGRTREAAEIWRHAIAKSLPISPTPDSRRELANMHNDLAWLLCGNPDADAYDPVAACNSAKSALELNPDHPAAWNTLGVARYRAGDPAGAIQAIQCSIERGGGDAFDTFPLAMAYQAIGEHEQARRHLQSALSWTQAHAPNHPDVKRLAAEAIHVCGANAL